MSETPKEDAIHFLQCIENRCYACYELLNVKDLTFKDIDYIESLVDFIADKANSLKFIMQELRND